MTRSFAELELLAPISRAVAEAGYDTPTPIQEQAIPHLLDGRDLLGIAQTGTGKTAAFSLPLLDFLAGDPLPRIAKQPSALILTPTRELAAQIGQNLETYGRYLDLRFAVIFGGVGQSPQVKQLRQGVDVLVATPGRLLDLMDQGHVRLDSVEVFVLDEADRMLDMGFLPAVRRVLAKLPKDRQSLLFSATMPPDIVAIAHSVLTDPVRVEVAPPATTVERIAQRIMLVEKGDKRDLLLHVIEQPGMDRVLVFTRTKHRADRIARHLKRAGVDAAAIHGDKGQGARERALDGFRSGSIPVLIATDIAARGIDVPEISHVINFDLPNVPESYVHRIGRTARAGRSGEVVSFCDVDEREHLRVIERTIRLEVEVVEDHPFRSTIPFERAPAAGRGDGARKPASGGAGGRRRTAGGAGKRRGGRGSRGSGRRNSAKR